MKKLSFLFIALVCGLMSHGQLTGGAPDWQWIKPLMGENAINVSEVCEGPNGKVYLAGIFSGTNNMFGTTVTPTNLSSGFIMQCDTGGYVDWFKEIEVPNNGRIYFTGAEYNPHNGHLVVVASTGEPELTMEGTTLDLFARELVLIELDSMGEILRFDATDFKGDLTNELNEIRFWEDDVIILSLPDYSVYWNYTGECNLLYWGETEWQLSFDALISGLTIQDSVISIVADFTDNDDMEDGFSVGDSTILLDEMTGNYVRGALVQLDRQDGTLKKLKSIHSVASTGLVRPLGIAKGENDLRLMVHSNTLFAIEQDEIEEADSNSNFVITLGEDLAVKTVDTFWEEQDLGDVYDDEDDIVFIEFLGNTESLKIQNKTHFNHDTVSFLSGDSILKRATFYVDEQGYVSLSGNPHKISWSGDTLWGLNFDYSASGWGTVNDLIRDQQGNVYLCFSKSGGVDLADLYQSDTTDSKTILMKISPEGDVLWEREYSSIYGYGGHLIEYEQLALFKEEEHLLFMGRFSGEVKTNDTLLSSNLPSCFIEKISAEGEVEWLHTIENAGNLSRMAITEQDDIRLFQRGRLKTDTIYYDSVAYRSLYAERLYYAYQLFQLDGDEGNLTNYSTIEVGHEMSSPSYSMSFRSGELTTNQDGSTDLYLSSIFAVDYPDSVTLYLNGEPWGDLSERACLVKFHFEDSLKSVLPILSKTDDARRSLNSYIYDVKRVGESDVIYLGYDVYPTNQSFFAEVGRSNTYLKLWDGIESSQERHSMVLAIDDNDRMDWAYRFKNVNPLLTHGHVREMASDDKENVYVSGAGNGLAYFGEERFSHNGDYHYIAKLDVTGQLDWMKPIYADGRIFQMEAIAEDNLLVGGAFEYQFENRFEAYYPSGYYGLLGDTLQSNTDVVLSEEGQFRLYPNPTNQNVQFEVLEGDLSQPLLIQVFSVDGRVVQENRHRNLSGTIDLEGLSNGVYRVRFLSENRQETLPLIITD